LFYCEIKVNFVGNTGIRNVMAITDGALRVRGMVGNPRFSNDAGENIPTRDLLGEGQIQIVRNHPVWKQPTNGIVLLRDIDISLNLAYYMGESEQRSAVLLTDVKVEGNLCRYSLGVMVERLPGCTDENIERSIKNLEEVEKKGLRSYLDRTDEERKADKGQFRDFTGSLDKILNDCLAGMDFENSIRWSKNPQFKCSCGVERVWRTLRLLPVADVRELLLDDGDVKVTLSLIF
jgi:redox-regulated HSP33 family molecular chaperone